MNHVGKGYELLYDPLDQQVDFEGTLRPLNEDETQSIFQYLKELHNRIEGKLVLNFQRLRYVSAAGVKALTLFVDYARESNSLDLVVVASSVLAWSGKILPNLQELWPKIEFYFYDENFYGSQEIIEEENFIPLLRSQTRIVWPVEKNVLVKHGLKAGMRVADICCGCGDVALLICRDIKPSYILGVDHSAAAVSHARRLQREFNIHNAEFQRGDATSLMLDANSFDFVICRLSLQIFSEPLLILKELIRIAKPGGRIYVICEDYDFIVGYPESKAIHQTYELAAEYGDRMGMDLRSGKKLFEMLNRGHLDDIRTNHMIIDTNSRNRDAFTQVIESWKKFSVDIIGSDLDLSEGELTTLKAGYDAQLRTIKNTNGYTTWGITVCSGTKRNTA